MQNSLVVTFFRFAEVIGILANDLFDLFFKKRREILLGEIDMAPVGTEYPVGLDLFRFTNCPDQMPYTLAAVPDCFFGLDLFPGCRLGQKTKSPEQLFFEIVLHCVTPPTKCFW